MRVFTLPSRRHFTDADMKNAFYEEVEFYDNYQNNASDIT